MSRSLPLRRLAAYGLDAVMIFLYLTVAVPALVYGATSTTNILEIGYRAGELRDLREITLWLGVAFTMVGFAENCAGLAGVIRSHEAGRMIRRFGRARGRACRARGIASG